MKKHYYNGCWFMVLIITVHCSNRNVYPNINHICLPQYLLLLQTLQLLLLNYYGVSLNHKSWRISINLVYVLSISYCNYSNPCWIQGIKNWIQGLDYNTIRVRDQSEKNLRIQGSKCKEWKGFFQTFVSKHLVEVLKEWFWINIWLKP
jgi:hypothetical protein